MGALALAAFVASKVASFVKEYGKYFPAAGLALVIAVVAYLIAG